MTAPGGGAPPGERKRDFAIKSIEGGMIMPVRYIPEYERKYLTEEALALAYSMCASGGLSTDIMEKTMTEAVKFGQSGGQPVDAGLFEALLWAVCDNDLKQNAGRELFDDAASSSVS
jgi:hypothetical protein